MAFEINNFNNVTSGQASEFKAKMWAYSTETDALSVVSTAGYFNQMRYALDHNNLIYIAASDGRALYYVTSAINAPNVTISELSESPTASDFADSAFAIYNNTDNTKRIHFDASGITTSTTRTITMLDADLTLADMAGQSASSVAITGGSIAGITDLAVADGGTGASDAPSARTNLGLGSMSTQNSSSVNIDGGSIDGVTLGVNSAITEAQIDDVKINGSTVGNASGDMTLLADRDLILSGSNNLVNRYLKYQIDTTTFLEFGTGTVDLQAAGSSKLDLSSSGVRFGGTGARITQFNNGSMSGGSATQVPTENSVVNYVSSVLPVPVNDFDDDVFRVSNKADDTKKLAFDISGVTTATTRTITMADQAVDLTPTTGTYQGSDAGLTDISGLATTDSNFIVGDGANWVAESGATARTSLGLGSMATQNLSAVDIDGGAIDGVTLGTNLAITEAQVDNLNLNGNTISSTDTNGNIILETNGTGDIELNSTDVYIETDLIHRNDDDTKLTFGTDTLAITVGGDETMKFNNSLSEVEIVNHAGDTSVSALSVLSGDSLSYANTLFTNDSALTFDVGINPSGAASNPGDAYIYTYGASGVRFGTNNVERAFISSGGTFVINTCNIDGGAIDGITLGTNSAVTEAQIDNLNINGSTITSSGQLFIDATNNINLEATTVSVERWIRSIADTSTSISIQTDNVDFYSAGTQIMDYTSSGLRLGTANSRVTTILDEDDMASDSNTSLVTQQSLKAFVETEADTILKAGLTWNWNSGTPVIKKNANVSSLTDTATGQVTVNFTASFADTNYFVGLGTGGNISDQLRCIEIDTKTTGSMTITFKYVEDGASVVVNTSDTSRDQSLVVFTN